MVLSLEGEIVKMNGGSDFKWATDVDERNLLWKTRHDILYACMALRPGCKVSDTDLSLYQQLRIYIVKNMPVHSNMNGGCVR